MALIFMMNHKPCNIGTTSILLENKGAPAANSAKVLMENKKWKFQH
jgi:hypothetical protein